MKAIIIQNNQDLQWQETEAPVVGDFDIAINNHCSAVNRADVMQRKGVYPPPPGASPILGLECAGVVSAVGAKVTQWKPGDSVCALLAGGGYAETVVCRADHALPVPDGFGFEQAAALPEVLATAWYNLFMLGGLKPQQKVLLHAGASGVGCAAIQLCKAFNNPCFVTVGSQEKLDFCLELGADAGHIRHQGEFEESVKQWAGNPGVAVILDPVGGNYLEQNLRCLGTDGHLINIGLMGGRSAPLDFGRLLIKRLHVMGSTLRSRDDQTKAEIVRQLRDKVWPLLTNGAVRPIIEQSFPIQQANQAFELITSNNTKGKVLLTII